jgi:hypothetical protein
MKSYIVRYARIESYLTTTYRTEISFDEVINIPKGAVPLVDFRSRTFFFPDL